MGTFLQQPLGLPGIGPQRRVGRLPFQFGQPAPELVGVKDTSGRRRWWRAAGEAAGANR